MANRKLTEEEKAAWEKLYEKDLIVIGGFLKFLQQTHAKNFRFYFDDGSQIIASLSGAGDSDNGLDLDDPYYEEFYELYFIVEKIERKGADWDFEEGKLIALNYHNFFVKFEPYDGEISKERRVWQTENRQRKKRIRGKNFMRRI